MKLITQNDVVEKVGVSRQSIWRLRREKGFPNPRNIRGNRKNVWIEKEVDDWIEENLIDSQAKAPVKKKEAA